MYYLLFHQNTINKIILLIPFIFQFQDNSFQKWIIVVSALNPWHMEEQSDNCSENQPY